jgi:hypothetical protein
MNFLRRKPRQSQVDQSHRRLRFERLENRHLLSGATDPAVGDISGMFAELRDPKADYQEVRGSGVRDVNFHTFLESDFTIPAGQAVSPQNDSFDRTVHAQVVCNVEGVAFGLNFQVFAESTAGGFAGSEFNADAEYGGELARASTNLALNGQWAIYMLNFDMSVTLTETAISETTDEQVGGTSTLKQSSTMLEAGITGKIIARGMGASGGVTLSVNLANLWFGEAFDRGVLNENYWEDTANSNVVAHSPNFFVDAEGYASVVVTSVKFIDNELVASDDYVAMGSFDVLSNGSRDSFFSATAHAERIGLDASWQDGQQESHFDQFNSQGTVYNTGRWSTRSGLVGAGTLNGDVDDFATTRLRPRSNDNATTVDRVFTIAESGEETDYLKTRGLHYWSILYDLWW